MDRSVVMASVTGMVCETRTSALVPCRRVPLTPFFSVSASYFSSLFLTLAEISPLFANTSEKHPGAYRLPRHQIGTINPIPQRSARHYHLLSGLWSLIPEHLSFAQPMDQQRAPLSNRGIRQIEANSVRSIFENVQLR
jgi:hypothetical protein